MFSNNNTKKLSLERTVQWCVDSIDAIYDTNEILSRFGIVVVGQVSIKEDLPNRATYTGNYGDAYLVGAEPPYDYYIWTRPFSGETYGKWFNIGQFPLPGPQGIPGESIVGPEGKRGNHWYAGGGEPTTSITDLQNGDLYLELSTSDVWVYHDPVWVLLTNIKGEQGIQGERGPIGPATSVIEVYGILPSTTQLPDPTTVPHNAGYLIGTPGQNLDVYGIVGTGDELAWADFGMFSVGTQITVNGSPVEVWDADTKVDKLPTPAPNNRYVYTTRRNNVELKLVTANSFTPDTFPWRDGKGDIKVPANPSSPNAATSMSYVDSQVSMALDSANQAAYDTANEAENRALNNAKAYTTSSITHNLTSFTANSQNAQYHAIPLRGNPLQITAAVYPTTGDVSGPTPSFSLYASTSTATPFATFSLTDDQKMSSININLTPAYSSTGNDTHFTGTILSKSTADDGLTSNIKMDVLGILSAGYGQFSLSGNKTHATIYLKMEEGEGVFLVST